MTTRRLEYEVHLLQRVSLAPSQSLEQNCNPYILKQPPRWVSPEALLT